MSIPDWTEANDKATHYDCNADVFCNYDGWWSCKGKYYLITHFDWGSSRYTPRPVSAEGNPPMDDNCPAARIGEIGNQVHNLGCDYQNDEDLSDELGQVAVTLWDLAKKSATRTQAQTEREELENLLTRAIASGLTVKSLVSCIIARGYRIER